MQRTRIRTQPWEEEKHNLVATLLHHYAVQREPVG